MTHRFTFDTLVTRGDEEIEVRVTYSVSPFIDATYWQPAEGGEVEIISVRANGQEIALTDAEETKIFEEAQNRAQDDLRDEAAAEADWRYQERRDRQLMAQWENEA